MNDHPYEMLKAILMEAERQAQRSGKSLTHHLGTAFVAALTQEQYPLMELSKLTSATLMMAEDTDMRKALEVLVLDAIASVKKEN